MLSLKKIVGFSLISVLFLAGCKSTEKPVKTASATINDAQKAEIMNVFFNASKEKVLGNLDNAASLFSEVIRRDPGNAAAMYELANIFSSQKKYADALFFAKSAYLIDRKNSWYALTYSDILQKN